MRSAGVRDVGIGGPVDCYLHTHVEHVNSVNEDIKVHDALYSRVEYAVLYSAC